MSPLRPILPPLNTGRICPICHQPVLLENCKTDEHGQATHEECYVHKVCSHIGRDEERSSAKASSHLPRNLRSR